jgi:hypothetical protein
LDTIPADYLRALVKGFTSSYTCRQINLRILKVAEELSGMSPCEAVGRRPASLARRASSFKRTE